MPDLVIFDCDGVLVDSEVIFARVLGECLTAADFAATAEEALALGFGKNRDSLTTAVETLYGRVLPDTSKNLILTMLSGRLIVVIGTDGVDFSSWGRRRS